MDVDGDGDSDLDVLWSSRSLGGVGALENLGGGQFGPQIRLVSNPDDSTFRVRDLDEAGDLDLILLHKQLFRHVPVKSTGLSPTLGSPLSRSGST